MRGPFRHLRDGEIQTLQLLLIALLVGSASGLASVLFLRAIGLVQQLAFGVGDAANWLEILRLQPAWRILLAPALAGLLVGLIVHWGLPNRRPVGVSQVIEASALKGAALSSRVGLRAALAAVLSIGGGASVGREGPMVHFAGSLGAWAGKSLRLGREPRRILLAAGVAAGIAASFNAPLAGTLFALEVVLGHYAVAAFAPVVVAAVIGTLISRSLLGDSPAFALADLAIVSPLEFPAFALLGLLCGLAAALTTASLTRALKLRNRLPGPGWLHPAVAGLLVGALALAFPQVLGVGYEALTQALAGQVLPWLALVLFAAKLLATAISLGGGFVGGVISPSLFLGAMLGAAFGALALAVAPVEASSSSVYVLVGMGATTAAVIGAPISTILFLFELTGNYPVTLGVMLAVVIATVVSRSLGQRSLFIESLSASGVRLSGGHDVGQVRNLTVWELVDRSLFPIAPDLGFAEVRERLLRARWGQLYVVDGEHFVGAITLKSWQAHLEDADPSHLSARDLIADIGAIPADSTVPAALKLFRDNAEAHLPVVSGNSGQRLVGVVHEHDLALAYHRAVLKARGMEDEV